MFKHVIIAVDDSDDSYKAAEMGIEIAKLFSGKVTFAYVVTDEYIKTVYGDAKRIKKSRSPFDDFLLEQARTSQIGNQVFGKLVSLAQKMQFSNIETKMLNGNPSSELVNEIQGGPYDLAIVGRTGASKAQRSIFGNCIDPVIQLTSIPTLIVNK